MSLSSRWQRRCARQRRRARSLAVGRDQVDGGEWQIRVVPFEHAAGDGARLQHRLGFPGLGRKRLSGLQTALAEHPLGRLGDRYQHAADATALLADRAVREDEVTLLDEAMPLERKHEIDERGGPALHHALEHRTDDVPISAKVSRVLMPIAAGCFVEPRMGR